jgi:HlyD family secretion protein
VELELELLSLPTDRRNLAMEELAKLEPLKVKLLESRAELEASLNQLEVRAPIAGIIHDSQVGGLRSVVVEATPIMYVVPTDRPVSAILRIDAHDIDQVHMRQSVSMRFSAFNRRAMSIIEGEVVGLSPDAFVDPVTRGYYYEARVAFEGDAVQRLDGRLLVPGMPVEGFFATEPQTPFAYVTRPLLSYFSRAYRDA